MFKKIPHTYLIIFGLIVLAALLTCVVPAGSFERTTVITESGREITKIDPNSYQRVESSPQTWQVFSAFFKGFQRAPGIIAFILILGGTFWIINESKAIDMGVQAFLKKALRLENYAFFRKIGVQPLIIASVMLLFSFFGAVFGMSEETIAFVIIFVPLAISMGYDSIVGVCMCFIGAGLGFAGCILNPFTLGIAQDIAGLPMFSGIEYRFLVWIVINTVGIFYVLRYAAAIKRRPVSSIMYQEDAYWRNQGVEATKVQGQASCKGTLYSYIFLSLCIVGYAVLYALDGLDGFSFKMYTFILLCLFSLLFIYFGYKAYKQSVQMFALHLLLFCVAFLVFGVMEFSWDFSQIAALFMALAIFTGIALGKSSDDIIKLFIAGAKDILGAALVVGLAGGIIVVLEDGKIIDTFLQGAAASMEGVGKFEALGLMYGFQSILNAVITSGTAKAAMLMPIFSEISQMIGVSLQATVTAFHIGDGFTNLITPTSGVLIGVLEIARIPYTKWLKWAWRLIAVMVILGFLLLIPTVFFELKGF